MRQTMQTALDIKKPWQDKEPWPKEAAEVQFLIGMCQMELVNYVKAFEAFNSAIRINPEYAEAYYQRGLVRMRLKQSKGVQDFNRALAINPTLYQAYLSRAAFYGMKGRYSKGIINCNEAIKLQPHSVRAYMYRGALKYHIHAFDLAIRDLTKAIDIDNTCSLAYFNRAVCYHTMKQYDKALRDYGIVLLLGEENALKVLINRGLMYFERKDYKNALQDFYNAVKVEPNDPKIRHTLGLCFHKLNKLEEAVKHIHWGIRSGSVFLRCLNWSWQCFYGLWT
uniref:Tetratricopeptide repeat protein 6-like n=1 Tax=Saccoglossus kowalevskii TaxID=10224 RepID=A0ABM0MQE2_SACKO|nr:PREDICTED: tetratricopeptide repeat protein 6-like [Saccoglossus kowalevskii]